MKIKSYCVIVSLYVLLLSFSVRAAEQLNFSSFTPEDYAEILNGKYKNKPVQLRGFFTHPKPGTKVPAVVIVPGSGGYAEWMQTTVAKPLNDAGVATLIIDSFSGRGVGDTASDQGRVPMSASVMDGFQALNMLAQRNDIEPKRIGVTGFSRGGVVSMFTAERRLQEVINPQGQQFAAHLPFYPGCSTQWMSPQPSKAPIKFLLGEKDDMTPAAVCVGYIDRLLKLGAKASYTIYPGAHHAWTADYAQSRSNTVQTFGNCDLKIDNDGEIKDMKSGATTREGWRTFVGKVIQSCGGTGATLGANAQAREASIADMVAFFKQNLFSK